MTRTQYCREHIDKVALECDLGKSVVSDVKQAAKFCAEHSDLSDCSTRAIIALIRVKDEPVRIRAIQKAESALAEETGGRKKTNSQNARSRASLIGPSEKSGGSPQRGTNRRGKNP